MLNLELYKVFYYAAKTGSISNAAKELFITQPAVSQSIKQLETELGGKVFFRTSRGIKLTSEGRVLYKYIEQAYGLIRTAENKFLEMQNLLSGEIKIGAGDTLSKYYLLPYLREFHEKYPQIKVQVTNRTTFETIELLKSGKVDFGIINLPIKNRERLVIHEVLTVEDCFVCGEKYKDLAQKPISVKDLSNYPLLLLEKGSNTRGFVDNFFLEHNVEVVPEIELGSVNLLIEFAKIGLGISYVVKDFIEDELRNGKVFKIDLLEKIPKRKIGVITLKDVPISSSAKEFLRMLNMSE